jgi:tetratricopeptide (TPR) repeat protein
VAEIFLSQRDFNKAIANWTKATELTPGLLSVHAKLAQAFERLGNKKEAIYHYLTLAYNFPAQRRESKRRCEPVSGR